MTPEQARLGAIAASAGNHALGLAWHGRSLGIPVTVVMPRFAPLVKVARCRQFGAKVVLHGDTFDGSRSEAWRLAEERALTYIHPFDDPQVIAGQGTLAFEILEQVPDAEAIVVPVGGGGLLAGVATVLQALKPSLQIIGVEPANAACFAAGLAADATGSCFDEVHPGRWFGSSGSRPAHPGHRSAVGFPDGAPWKRRRWPWPCYDWRSWRSASSKEQAPPVWRRCWEGACPNLKAAGWSCCSPVAISIPWRIAG